MRTYVINDLGGEFPVQGHGYIGGKTKFYFRARGASWSLSVGREPISSPDWEHFEDYGVWPEAGQMPIDEAKKFIEKAINLYWDETVPRRVKA